MDVHVAHSSAAYFGAPHRNVLSLRDEVVMDAWLRATLVSSLSYIYAHGADSPCAAQGKLRPWIRDVYRGQGRAASEPKLPMGEIAAALQSIYFAGFEGA
jgi:hypothetical protein